MRLQFLMSDLQSSHEIKNVSKLTFQDVQQLAKMALSLDDDSFVLKYMNSDNEKLSLESTLEFQNAVQKNASNEFQILVEMMNPSENDSSLSENDKDISETQNNYSKGSPEISELKKDEADENSASHSDFSDGDWEFPDSDIEYNEDEVENTETLPESSVPPYSNPSIMSIALSVDGDEFEDFEEAEYSKLHNQDDDENEVKSGENNDVVESSTTSKDETSTKDIMNVAQIAEEVSETSIPSQENPTEERNEIEFSDKDRNENEEEVVLQKIIGYGPVVNVSLIEVLGTLHQLLKSETFQLAEHENLRIHATSEVTQIASGTEKFHISEFENILKLINILEMEKSEHPEFEGYRQHLTGFILSQFEHIDFVHEFLHPKPVAVHDDNVNVNVNVIVDKKEMDKNVSDSLVLHKNIICDGCYSRSMNQDTQYIRGIRYKSVTLTDFDLCSDCEASKKFKDYGPFLKINDPTESPTQIFCVLPENESSKKRSFHEKRNRHSCRWNRETKNDSKSNKLCVKTACNQLSKSMNDLDIGDDESNANKENNETNKCDLESNKIDKSDKTDTKRKCKSSKKCKKKCKSGKEGCCNQIFCPSKHKLQQNTVVIANYFCDKCGKELGIDAKIFSCRPCDYDLCDKCYNQKKQTKQSLFDGKSKIAVVQDPNAMKRGSHSTALENETNEVPQARFKSDVTLPDGSIVIPGADLKKVWRLENCGTIPWPKHSRLVFVGGHSLGAQPGGLVLENEIVPGETAELIVDLVAPAKPGRYIGYWRLHTPGPNPQRFGQRIWVDITVDGTFGEQFAAAIAEPIRKLRNDVVARFQEEMLVKSDVSPNAIAQAVPVVQGEESNQDTNPTEHDNSSLQERDPIDEGRLLSFTEELQQLFEMGFQDVSRNANLMLEENGNLDHVINRLCSEE